MIEIHWLSVHVYSFQWLLIMHTCSPSPTRTHSFYLSSPWLPSLSPWSLILPDHSQNWAAPVVSELATPIAIMSAYTNNYRQQGNFPNRGRRNDNRSVDVVKYNMHNIMFLGKVYQLSLRLSMVSKLVRLCTWARSLTLFLTVTV